MSVLNILLERLIDYAGLCPPAELSMRAAVENYQRYLREPQRWMLGRFILPTTRLREFEAAIGELEIRSDDERPWLVSALLSPIDELDLFEAELDEIGDFNLRHNKLVKPLAEIDSVEVKVANEIDVARALTSVSRSINLFLELQLGQNLDKLLQVMDGAKKIRDVMAKIRTGGVVSEDIPPVDRVAAFISGCAMRNIGFKATAGLHHPIRASYRLTYREESPCAIMYGFLNMFVAACEAYDKPKYGNRIPAILTETDITRFEFDDEAIHWRGNTWRKELVQSVREKAVSFGSCSFVEPIDDLRKLNLLP